MRDKGLIDRDQLEQNVAVVIKGERISRRYRVDGAGNRMLFEEVVTINPADVARGAMVLDALDGGDMGLSPEVMHTASPTTDDMYQQYAPKQVNGSIIQNVHARDTLLVIDVKEE
jgi:hypothetical protein